MAVPACLRLGDEVFPKVRAVVARRLVQGGWSQARAGQALGLSQAMVSKHIAAGAGAVVGAGPSDPLIERLAEELHRELVEPTLQPAQGPSAWCSTLATGERPGGEAALRDLLAAERAVREANPQRVMPQVGLNIARALPDSKEAQDILAFPGRLVEAGGRIVSPAPPAYGGSGHLARCLLAARSRWPDVLSVANVRGSPDVLPAARGLGWTVLPAARPAGSAGAGAAGDDEAPFVRAVGQAGDRPDAVHDPGAVGVEACLYILASDASDAARRILQLNDRLVNP